MIKKLIAICCVERNGHIWNSFDEKIPSKCSCTACTLRFFGYFFANAVSKSDRSPRFQEERKALQKLLLFVFCLLGSWVALSAGRYEERLESKLNAFKSMQADFSQAMVSKGEQISKSKGRMALERPGKFRWDTQKPMAQLVIADGNHLWIYDVDLEQVTVKKQQKNLGGSAGFFLSGYDATAAKNFSVTSQVKNNRETFDLQAKSDQENFQRILLTFTGSILSDMTLYDQLDQKTVIHFTHVKTNDNLPASLFVFKPPKGVDVIRE